MKLKVPYFKQLTEYTCGPASLAMVLAFFGKHKSELALSRQTKTTEEHGTTHLNIIQASRNEGFKVEVKSGATLGDLKLAIRSGSPTIVNYTEPFEDIGHYAVVIGFERDWIILNDPTHGKGFRITQENFLHRWKSRNSKRWMLKLELPQE